MMWGIPRPTMAKVQPMRRVHGGVRKRCGHVLDIEAAGPVVTRRGAGTRVTEHVEQLPAATIQQELQAHARRFVRGAVSLGADPATIRDSVDEALSEE